jgi:hypothetical protein
VKGERMTPEDWDRVSEHVEAHGGKLQEGCEVCLAYAALIRTTPSYRVYDTRGHCWLGEALDHRPKRPELVSIAYAHGVKLAQLKVRRSW